jgi:hypothetical protein
VPLFSTNAPIVELMYPGPLSQQIVIGCPRHLIIWSSNQTRHTDRRVDGPCPGKSLFWFDPQIQPQLSIYPIYALVVPILHCLRNDLVRSLPELVTTNLRVSARLIEMFPGAKRIVLFMSTVIIFEAFTATPDLPNAGLRVRRVA